MGEPSESSTPIAVFRSNMGTTRTSSSSTQASPGDRLLEILHWALVAVTVPLDSASFFVRANVDTVARPTSALRRNPKSLHSDSVTPRRTRPEPRDRKALEPTAGTRCYCIEGRSPQLGPFGGGTAVRGRLQGLMIDLKGHLAIVTGGSKGIGRAIARALLRESAEVAICGRDRSALASAIREMGDSGRIVGHPCDVSRWSDAQAFYAFVDRELGGVDILVNNAGVGRFGPVGRLSPEDWDEVIQTNLSGPFYFSHLAVPRMKQRGGGFILNIGSLAGKHPFAGGAAYNASKFGLAGFTEAMMLDLRYANIRVSTIMPGSVQTGFRGRPTAAADWKLDPAAVASMAVHLIKTPARNLASRVEMRPSKPPRK